MKLKIHVCAEDGELLVSDEADVSTNPADIRAAKFIAADAVEEAVSILLARSQRERA